jgi:4-hydroxy-4-methyl-2-oxoglutarate aldolase
MFGELFATALLRRGVRGLVINAGVRDTAELRAMGFPVWSAAVSAQGSVKETGGAVNVPIAIGGQIVQAGDAIIADDDGAMCVSRPAVVEGIRAARTRTDTEAKAREAFEAGELSLDRYDLRRKLADLGVVYRRAQ